MLQSSADSVDGADDACNHAESEDTQSWQDRKLQLEQAVDRLDGGEIDPGDEKNRGTGDSGQNHSRDGGRAGKKQNRKLKRPELCIVDGTKKACIGAKKCQSDNDKKK